MSSFKQGYYTPRNPSKYLEPEGKSETRPFYRSSYEERVFVWADINDNVIRWGSECVIVPYILYEWSEKYQKMLPKKHKYYIDLYCEIRNKFGKVDKYIAEVKPLKQISEPKKPKRNTKKSKERYLFEQATWEKNKAKWAAAEQYAKENGLQFILLTENEIFNK